MDFEIVIDSLVKIWALLKTLRICGFQIVGPAISRKKKSFQQRLSIASNIFFGLPPGTSASPGAIHYTHMADPRHYSYTCHVIGELLVSTSFWSFDYSLTMSVHDTLAAMERSFVEQFGWSHDVIALPKLGIISSYPKVRAFFLDAAYQVYCFRCIFRTPIARLMWNLDRNSNTV